MNFSTGIWGDGTHPDLPRGVGYGSWEPKDPVDFELVGYLQQKLPEEAEYYYRENLESEWEPLEATNLILKFDPISRFYLRVVIPYTAEF